MAKCVVCGKEKSDDELVPILKRGTDCCTSDPNEDEISKKLICTECLDEFADEPQDALYGFCDLDYEKSYALHVSDLKPNDGVFYCKEHIGETSNEYDDDDDF